MSGPTLLSAFLVVTAYFGQINDDDSFTDLFTFFMFVG